MMAGWIASGGIAGCILALTVLEVAALALYRRITGSGLVLAEYLPNILAGDFLLLAWWCAAAHWAWAAAALLGALLAHTADMAGRMKHSRPCHWRGNVRSRLNRTAQVHITAKGAAHVYRDRSHPQSGDVEVPPGP